MLHLDCQAVSLGVEGPLCKHYATNRKKNIIFYLWIILPSLVAAHSMTSYQINRTSRIGNIKAVVIRHYLIPLCIGEHLELRSRVRMQKWTVSFIRKLLIFQIKEEEEKKCENCQLFHFPISSIFSVWWYKSSLTIQVATQRVKSGQSHIRRTDPKHLYHIA